ncbi:oligosaccharide flippase family protein [Campylobacter geochelonis]|uniref:oligosaccharide flippase family protein n=1 Tax=Campylobacter geochelonis TaxID=1780362 RepID=UPI000770AC8E|nr:oligosaccharide flippase family protein [Campylobacter geochelonis]CZE47031.1 virulence factor MviN family protein [Campylobacter geochelonis]
MSFFILTPDKQRRAGVLLSYANIFLGTFLAFVYTPFMLRMLGQSEFGIYSLAASVIGYLAILDLGFGNAIIVFTSKYITQNRKDDEKKLHGTIFSIYLVMSIVVLIAGALFVVFADAIFSSSMSTEEIAKMRIMFALLTLNLAISFPFSIYSSILSAYENFIFIKLISIFRTALMPILMVPMLLLGHKAITMVVVVTLINLACLLADFIYCKRVINPQVSPKNFDKSVLKEVFSYSFFIFLGMIVDQVNWNVDNFILGVVASSVAVSMYSVALIINNMFITLSVTISGVMLPKMAKMVSSNSTNTELTNELIKVGRLQYYIIFLIGSLIVLFGREFIVLWAGAEYEISYYITLILVVPVCIPLIQNLGISILQAKNMFKFRAIAAFFMTLVNIAISIPLAKLYGGVGSAIGTAFALVVLNIFIMNFYYHFKVGLDMIRFWKSIAKMSFVFVLYVGLILIFMHYIRFSGIWFLIVNGGIYILIYIFIAVKFVMNEYEKAILNSLLTKFRIKI